MRSVIGGLLVMAAFVVAPAAAAADDPGGTFGAAEQARAVREVEAQVKAHYVFPERRVAILDRLAASAAKERYRTSDPALFAERVTEDLQASNHDTHLYLRYEPDWYASAVAPAGRGDDEHQARLEDQIARETNHGLVEMRMLPGNIRYLKIEGFDWVPGETGAAYDAAMRFLHGGRAVILDLRGNGGGWVEASKYLLSHFLDANTLIATFYRPEGEPEQYRTVDYVPAGRVQGRPVYVLIDGHSRSAAEMVAYTFQQYRLGELVGARTEGAANVSDDFPVAPGFRLSVSTGRTVQPISKTDWEGVGVAPTVEVDPAQALEVAELRAIDRLLPGAEGIARNQLQWEKPAVEAALHPIVLNETELAGFADTFGEASTRVRDHALWLVRPGRPELRLKAMTREGLFQAVDEDTLRVRIKPDALEVLRIDPAYSRTYQRAGR